MLRRLPQDLIEGIAGCLMAGLKTLLFLRKPMRASVEEDCNSKAI